VPELPDLQVFSGNLISALKSTTVVKVNVVTGKNLKATGTEFNKRLKGAIIEKVYRERKELHVKFNNKTILGPHLMLHGNLYLVNKKIDKKHTIIEFQLDDGNTLVLSDWQGKANARIDPDIKDSPNALSKTVTSTWLLKHLLAKKGVIKNVLLDQNFIRGIGNASADEILWEARISPFSVANKIPASKVKGLAKAIKTTLKTAEKLIRKNHPGIITGEYREFLKIHNARNKQSPTGKKILSQQTNGRPTYYTQE
jgi:formamidopyrimidine-DNA glycosylase